MSPNPIAQPDGRSRTNGVDDEILARTSFFRFIPKEQQARLQELFKRVHYEFGEFITKQNDAADAFFVILSGRARVIRMSETGEELSLDSMGVGSEFGESALLSGGTRNASIRCSSPVDALRLDRDDFLQLAEEFPEFRRSLELTARWRAMRGFLYEFSNFGRLPGPALMSLVDRLNPKEFAKGDIVLREGEPAGPMYIIEKGRLRVYAGSDGQVRQLAFLREGNFFGELSILTGAPRAGTVQAMTDCRLLALAPDVVQEMNRQFPEFARLMEERRAQYNLATEAHVPLDFAQEELPAEASTANKVELDEPDQDLAQSPQELDSKDPFADETGLFRKRNKRVRSISLIQQIDEADCGAASLAMICRHFGRKVSLARIRQLCHTAQDGTTLKGITHAATELGLAARALKVSLRNLPRLPLPAIIHWQGNHWMVLIDVTPKLVRVADPASGTLRRIPRAEFEQNWSGYAALFDYTVAFEKAPEGSSSAAWLTPFIRQHRGPLLQAIFLAGVATALLLLLPIFTQVVVDKVIVERDLDLLKLCVGGMFVTGAFTLASSLIQQYLLSFAAVHLDTGMLDFLMRNMLALPMSYFQNRRTGDIQRRLDGARQMRLFFIQHGIGGLLAGVQIIGCIALMGLYSWSLLGVFLLTMPFYAGLMFFSVKVLRPLFAELEEGQAKYSSFQIDAIKGIEAVKAAAAENAFRELMLNEFLRLSQKRFKWNFIVMSYDSIIQTISLLSTALFLWVGATMVIHNQISVGGFVAFNALVAMACASAIRMMPVWEEFQMILVLMNRLNDIFEQEPEQGRDRSHLKPVPTLEGHLQLRHLGFRFGGPESPLILDDINLEVSPGKVIAIVGRSGSGKTTLVKLIAGLMEPTEGTILFDRVDLKSLNYRDLRAKIGLVLQENHIFSDSILSNIAFGDPDPDFDRVLWAAQLANAHELISRLPFGYETRIGETGLALSGGQKQRVCIARALYHDPQVLIFDEATSALDSESERAIQENMSRLIKGRTCLVIAHRLSTIRDADSILVLERGKVAELGTHDELMARRGLYFYLSSQQLSQ
jgi:ATP-binding cassette subfamily B protein